MCVEHGGRSTTGAQGGLSIATGAVTGGSESAQSGLSIATEVQVALGLEGVTTWNCNVASASGWRLRCLW